MHGWALPSAVMKHPLAPHQLSQGLSGPSPHLPPCLLGTLMHVAPGHWAPAGPAKKRTGACVGVPPMFRQFFLCPPVLGGNGVLI